MSATAFVLINTELGTELDAVRSIKNVPGVTEAYLVYGTYDIIVKIQGDNLDKVKQTITQSLRTMSNVRSTLSMVVVES
jgi:DNA-binding Lrp family transcriptional regulator